MAHGKASALDLELCDALREEVQNAAEQKNVHALVLTGTGTIFSAGVDLPRLVNSGREYVQSFLEALDSSLQALFLFPKPAVAAINGHAIAGGAILAFACDYRIMSAGRIGVPEQLVGIPFPALALEIVRFGVPPRHLRSVILFGHTYEAGPAHEMGLIDEVVSPMDLQRRAGEVASQLGGVPMETFRLTKRMLREPSLRDAAQIAATTVDQVDALWCAPESHERIRAYLGRTIGKK
jgi:enoyl-CoA hydratase